jgi:hypothetical protein
MTRRALLIAAALVLSLTPHAAQSAAPVPSLPALLPAFAQIAGAPSEEALTAFARRGGIRTANVGRTGGINRNVNIDRNVNINRNIARVGVGGVAVGAVRPWVRRPYFGTVVAGVALGTIIAATTIPPAPSSGLCWYWSNSSRTRGYWDYCQ